MYHYASPPPGWSYDYVPSPSAPPFSPYYGAHYAPPHTPPPRSKRHGYRASYSAAKDGPWHPSSPGFGPWQSYYDGVPDYASTPRKHENVSATFGGHGQRRRERDAGGWWTKHATPAYEPFVDVDDDDLLDDLDYDDPFVTPSARRSQRRPAAYADEVYHAFDSSDDDRPSHEQRYHYYATHSTYASRHEPSSRRKARPTTDGYFYYSQVPEETDMPKRSRGRRASTSARTPPRPTKPSSMKTPPKATEEDAIRAGIPEGYSIKNWDPTEAPILLLGSVFDANSLGKWIYDWTVFHYGATAPMADVAGELWLLLIRLAGKVKRADECAALVRSPESREMLEDFLESGERLWARFKKLLKACEHFMWKAAKREGGKTITMGRSAGCEFVNSIFGRERELENTEKLMHSIRLWNMRFDANCDDILKRPDRA